MDCEKKDKQRCIELTKRRGDTPPAIIGRIADSDSYFDVKTKKPLKVIKISNLRTSGMGSSHEVIVSKVEPLVTARGDEVRGQIDQEVLIKGLEAGQFEKKRVRQYLNIQGSRANKNVEIAFADSETNGPFAHFLKLRPISDDECGLNF